uniref:Polypeptide N-acetylgalactosaminyltransferase n=1 Tax=Nyssomyia neivai TaxID=330878 RepID=A0A1L8E1A6_9DIPT
MRRNSTRIIKLSIIFFIAVIIMVFLYKSLYDEATHLPVKKEKIPEHPRHGAFFGGAPKNVHKRKIDWHDYETIKLDSARQGVGEKGLAALVPVEENDLKESMYRANGFNALLSDKISVNRSIPDIRHAKCKEKKYLSELPTVSVIVPFYEEHWSTLLRTTYSVLNRSPPELIAEIILVDDGSERTFLKEPLDHFVDGKLSKVKVIHLQERAGLIGARLAGAKVATGDVLVFLDSHTEANVNWLPPLLDPIAANYRVCTCPFIDVIAHDTFEYRAQDEGARGAFDWQFHYKRLPLLEKDKAHPDEPFASPVMAGGLFAISTKFFWELGGYDPGLDIWGGEQYELSFKIWQCGGAMYDIPCSRVGHVYRGPMDARPNPRKVDFVSRNYKRVAEVWMDEYKEYLYERRPDNYKGLDPGDLTEQKAVRERLQCKSFKWFMEEVAFDLIKKYPPVEPADYANGVIQNVGSPHLCVDTLNVGNGGTFGLFSCAANHVQPQKNQWWALSWRQDLRQKHEDLCWDVSSSERNAPILLWHCHTQGGNQYFRYDPEKQWILQGVYERCVEGDPIEKKIFVNQCDEENLNMKWQWGFVNSTAMALWDEERKKEGKKV